MSVNLPATNLAARRPDADRRPGDDPGDPMKDAPRAGIRGGHLPHA